MRRMFVGITGCLVPLFSRARVRTMETLGRASGSLTFGLNTTYVSSGWHVVYVTLNHVGGAEDLRAAFQESLHRRQGAPAAQRVTMSSSAVRKPNSTSRGHREGFWFTNLAAQCL